jgi:hypothetical protein
MAIDGRSEARGGAPSAFSFRWPAPDEGRSEFQVSAEFAADGYRGFATTVEFPAGGGVKRLDVRLEPLRDDEIGTLWLESHLRDERGRDVPVSVTHFVTMGRTTLGSGVEVGAPHAGAFPVRLPSGTSTISVTPQSPFGQLMEWKGEVVVSGGRESRLPVPWEPYGSLLLNARDAPRSGGRTETSLTAADGVRSASDRTLDRRLHAPAVPAGTWRLRRTAPWSPAEQSIRIEAGATTTVDVGD